MSKMAKAHSLPGGEEPLKLVQSMAELQELLSEMQPQKQLAALLSRLQSELQSVQNQQLDEVASKLEPLVQGLATLAAETHSTLQRVQAEASKVQQEAATVVQNCTAAMQAVSTERQRLVAAVGSIEKAARHDRIRWALSVLLASVVAVLTFASLLLWRQESLRPPLSAQSQSERPSSPSPTAPTKALKSGERPRPKP